MSQEMLLSKQEKSPVGINIQHVAYFYKYVGCTLTYQNPDKKQLQTITVTTLNYANNVIAKADESANLNPQII